MNPDEIKGLLEKLLAAWELAKAKYSPIEITKAKADPQVRKYIKLVLIAITKKTEDEIQKLFLEKLHYYVKDESSINKAKTAREVDSIDRITNGIISSFGFSFDKKKLLMAGVNETILTDINAIIFAAQADIFTSLQTMTINFISEHIEYRISTNSKVTLGDLFHSIEFISTSHESITSPIIQKIYAQRMKEKFLTENDRNRFITAFRRAIFDELHQKPIVKIEKFPPQKAAFRRVIQEADFSTFLSNSSQGKNENPYHLGMSLHEKIGALKEKYKNTSFISEDALTELFRGLEARYAIENSEDLLESARTALENNKLPKWFNRVAAHAHHVLFNANGKLIENIREVLNYGNFISNFPAEINKLNLWIFNAYIQALILERSAVFIPDANGQKTSFLFQARQLLKAIPNEAELAGNNDWMDYVSVLIIEKTEHDVFSTNKIVFDLMKKLDDLQKDVAALEEPDRCPNNLSSFISDGSTETEPETNDSSAPTETDEVSEESDNNIISESDQSDSNEGSNAVDELQSNQEPLQDAIEHIAVNYLPEEQLADEQIIEIENLTPDNQLQANFFQRYWPLLAGAAIVALTAAIVVTLCVFVPPVGAAAVAALAWMGVSAGSGLIAGGIFAGVIAGAFAVGAGITACVSAVRDCLKPVVVGEAVDVMPNVSGSSSALLDSLSGSRGQAAGRRRETAAQNDAAEPAAQNDAAEPAAQNDAAEPAAQNDAAEPAARDDAAEPAAQNDAAEPTAQNDAAEPAAQNDAAEPTARDDAAEPTVYEAKQTTPIDIQRTKTEAPRPAAESPQGSSNRLVCK